MTHKRHHEHFEESMENDEQLPVVEEETPEQKQEEANAELEALKAEAAKFKDLYVRAEAEMENLRRRTQKSWKTALNLRFPRLPRIYCLSATT